MTTSQLTQENTRLQKKIQQLEDRYRTVFDNVGDAIFIHNLSGQLLEVNQRACDQLGYSRKELLQLNLADIDSPENCERIPARIELLQQKERLCFESEHRRQDGQFIPVEITSQLIEYGEAPAILSVARDITEREQAGKNYRTLVERSLLGIFVLQDGRVVFANPALSKIGGYTLEELYNFSPQDTLGRIHPEDRERIQQNMQTRLAGEEVSAQQEFRLLHKDGTVRWVSSSTTVIDYQGRPALQVAYQDMTERKQTEEALRASEARFRLLVEQARDAFFLITEDGQIMDVNQQACEALGYSRNELLALNVSDVDSTYTLEASQRLWASLGQGGSVIVETEQRRKDGSTLPIEVNITKFPVDDEVFLLALARDITQRKQAEETLRQEYAFRTSIIKDAAEGLCVCHDITAYPYIEFTVWNDRMTEITGYTMEEINRRGWYQTVYPNPEIRSQAEDRMGRMRQGDNLHAERWEVVRADGQKRVLNITTSVLQTSDGTTHVLGLMDDVTERQQAEAALQESEERFRTLVNSMDDVVYTLDRDQRHVGVFGEWVKKQGLTPEFFLGKTTREIMGPENAAVHEAANQRALAGENVIYEWSIQTPNSTNYYQTSVSPLRDSQGEIVGIVGVGRDITANKRAEEAMLQASRLETAATLAGGIAHKINNLMTAVMGYAELVQHQLSGRPDVFKMLATISQSAQQAGDLAQQMLAFAHKGKYQPQPHNLNDTVREVLDLQQRTLPACIQIEPDLTPDLWVIEADPTQMSQIVLNLLTNAVEAIEDEGKITIVTKKVTIDKNLNESLPNLAFGQYVCLSTTDSGHGMSPETLARVFEPFFSTKFQGRGMGLAATFGIVENHGGHIALTSQPGEGTTCKVYLPAIQNGD